MNPLLDGGRTANLKLEQSGVKSVSYTHLDVYKRQSGDYSLRWIRLNYVDVAFRSLP